MRVEQCEADLGPGRSPSYNTRSQIMETHSGILSRVRERGQGYDNQDLILTSSLSGYKSRQDVQMWEQSIRLSVSAPSISRHSPDTQSSSCTHKFLAKKKALRRREFFKLKHETFHHAYVCQLLKCSSIFWRNFFKKIIYDLFRVLQLHCYSLIKNTVFLLLNSWRLSLINE